MGFTASGFRSPGSPIKRLILRRAPSSSDAKELEATSPDFSSRSRPLAI